MAKAKVKILKLRRCAIGRGTPDQCREFLSHKRKSNICPGCERYLEDAADRGPVWISKRQRQLGKWGNRLRVVTPINARKVIKKADKKSAPLIVSDGHKVSSPATVH